ncbi:DUF2007 domain-containing protein [Flavobacterium sp.]
MEEDFVLVGRFQYSSEAQIIKGKLEFEGIKVFFRDNITIDANPLYSNAIGGVKLFVNTENEVRAQLILASISPYSLDENNELLKCPECGSQTSEMYTSIRDLKSFLAYLISMAVVLLPFHTKHKYRCGNCKHEFN